MSVHNYMSIHWWWLRRFNRCENWQCNCERLLCKSLQRTSGGNYRILFHFHSRYVIPTCFQWLCTQVYWQLHITHATSSSPFLSLPAAKTYKGLNQSVCGQIGPLCEQFPNEQFANMCNCNGCTLSKPCPFEANTKYNITVDVPLSSTFPAVGWYNPCN